MLKIYFCRFFIKPRQVHQIDPNYNHKNSVTQLTIKGLKQP